MRVTKRFNEIIDYYHVKDWSGWDYYYKINKFNTYLGSLKLRHLHQTKIAANRVLESGITQSWGKASIPEIIERFENNQKLFKQEKVTKINAETFKKVYDKVLNDINTIQWEDWN